MPRQSNVEYQANGQPSVLAPVLGARRDGTARAESSRGLLMTILGEFLLPAGGTAWTRSLISLLGLLGVKDKAARQALARMEEQGWLTRERVGRQTKWSLTPMSTELLTAGAERIYRFGQGSQQRSTQWDGQWLVLLASVPENDRSARYRLGQGLSWAGFGSLGNGLWISPWTNQEAMAAQLLADLQVEATSFRAEVGALGSGRQLTEKAWDLAVVRQQYEAFLSETSAVNLSSSDDGAHEGVTDDAAAAATLTGLVHQWRRFPFLDPDLPADLLPDDWPGPAAAQRFASLRAELRPPAQRWWQRSD